MEVLARNWWALALRGLFGVVFGLVTLVRPGLTLAALVVLFGAYALVDGIFGVISAVRAAESHRRWGVLAVEGIAGIVAGILTFAWPAITAIVLLYLIAFWAIVTGLLEVQAAIQLRKESTGEWALVLGGVASIIFGLILIIFPGAGALAVLWLIGIYALLFGILFLMLAFRLRRFAPSAAMA